MSDEPLRKLFALFEFKSDLSGLKSANLATDKLRESAVRTANVAGGIAAPAARGAQVLAKTLNMVSNGPLSALQSDLRATVSDVDALGGSLPVASRKAPALFKRLLGGFSAVRAATSKAADTSGVIKGFARGGAAASRAHEVFSGVVKGFARASEASVKGIASASNAVGRAALSGGSSVVSALNDVRKSAFRPMKQDLESLGDTVGTVFPALIGLLAVPKIVEFSHAMIDAGDEADELSTALGMTVEQIQALQLFAKVGSVESGALSKGLRTLSKSVAEYRKTGKGKGAEVFADLKIGDAVKQSKSLEESFFLVGNAIAGIEDGEKKLAVSQKLFGTAGVPLITAFAGGEKEIGELRARIAKIGPLFDAEFAKSAGALKDELGFARLSLMSLGTSLLSKVLPAMRKGSEWFAKVSAGIATTVKQTKFLEAALAMLVTRWLGGMLISKLSFLTSGLYGATQGMRILAAASWRAMKSFFWIAIVALLFEDLIVWIKGGDSALGRFIDSVFGAGKSTEALTGLKQWWADFGPTITGSLGGAITFIGNFVGLLVSLAGYLTTSGAAQEKWGIAFGTIADKMVEKMQWLIKPIGEVFLWLEDSLANIAAKFRAFNPFSSDGLDKLKNGDMSPEATRNLLQQNLGNPTAGRVPVPAGTVQNKTLTLNDQRNTTLNFGDKPATPAAVATAVKQTQTDDRSFTAKAFGLA